MSPDFVSVELQKFPWISFRGCVLKNTSDDMNERVNSSACISDANTMMMVGQMHGGEIVVAGRKDAGIGVSRPMTAQFAKADGLITQEHGLPLAIRTADCVPLFLCDPKTRSIAALHAGWRGTLKRIAEHAVEHMVSRFGSVPSDIVAYLGPHICHKHYIVTRSMDHRFEDFQKSFAQDGGYERSGEKHINLASANAYQLKKSGIQIIEISQTCTYDSKLPSYYRDKSGSQLLHVIEITA